MSLDVKIQLFGPFTVLMAGEPLPPLRSRKGQWLLALLALRHGHEIERSWLAATLWPDSPEPHAFASLRQTLADLRNALGATAEVVQSPTNKTLRLQLPTPEAAIDLLAFDAAMARGDTASLEEALRLYHGTLLEGCNEDWLLPERTAREQSRLNLLETLAERMIDQDNPLQAQIYLRQVIALDPYRETSQRALMQLLAKSGNFADATLVYRNLRLFLRRELNTDPDPETTALYQKLRRATMQRGQETPTPVKETSPASPPPSLPRPLTRLVGRKEELIAIQNSLARTRLLTLTGSGGIGKTRLALSLGEAVAPEYPDGVWFVDLCALTEPELVAQTVASTLGLRSQQGRVILESLKDHLRSRLLLLILDNCEHLIAACADLAKTLLQACPQLKILATSREPLNVFGESPWRVPSLALPEPEALTSWTRETPESLLAYDSVRLFLDRAAMQRPDLALTPETTRTIAQVCYQLDGIPFALELAAARVKALSVEQIARRLDDSFRLLTGGSRTALPRQQTLRALIDWSYALLSLPERLLLHRVSVFRGGWTLDAAESICADNALDGEQILDLLGALVDKSLIVYETGSREPRYRLLETMRQYSIEKLQASAEEDILQHRHLAYFLTFAEAAEPELKKAEQIRWLELLEREHDNFRVALRQCQRSPEQAEIGLRLAGALAPFWGIHGDLMEGRSILNALLSLSQDKEAGEIRAKALNGLGALSYYQGDYTAAGDAFASSLVIRKALNDKRGVAVLLNNMGSLALFQGDFSRARALLEENLQLRRDLNEPNGLADALLNLGNVANEQGDYSAARILYEEALSIWRAVGLQKGIGYALFNLGNSAKGLGNYTEAERLYTESRELLEQIGDKRSIATLLQSQADMAYQRQDLTLAQTLALECLRRLEELGEKYVTARLLQTIAYLTIADGQAQKALRILGAAEALREAIHAPIAPAEQSHYRRNLAFAHTMLDAEQFAAAWASGRSLSMEQVIRYVYNTLE